MPRFLIDTDTAGDDVTSLLFGLRWPTVRLEAITVVAGNVYLDQAVENALYTVETAERPEVPVFPGADRPLLRPLVTAHYVHGDDGMGNSNFPTSRLRAQDMFAVDAILDVAARCDGELEIIAQGPLTNLALAVRKDPGLPARVKRLWIMGGSNNSFGNITPAAEFNFYVDPEAAHMVLGAGFDVVLVPWDVCVADGVLAGDDLRPIIDLGSPLSEFYLAVNRAVREFMRAKYGVDGIGHPDALTMAAALDDAVVLERARYFVDVEHAGELTRGYSVVDLMGLLGREPNADVVLRADKDLFAKMLGQVLASSPTWT